MCDDMQGSYDTTGQVTHDTSCYVMPNDTSKVLTLTNNTRK